MNPPSRGRGFPHQPIVRKYLLGTLVPERKNSATVGVTALRLHADGPWPESKAPNQPLGDCRGTPTCIEVVLWPFHDRSLAKKW